MGLLPFFCIFKKDSRTARIWCTFKRLDPIPYTDHVDEAVRQIEEAAELPSDRLLVSLVRAQRLFETVERGLDVQNAVDVADSAAPAIGFVEQSSERLDTMQNVGFPRDLASNSKLPS